MIWLLAIHIMALVCWAGSLLYLPALTAVEAKRGTQRKEPSLTRTLFTLFATPAALLAIISGTSLFLVKHLVAGWLVAKLTLVAALVVCHLLNGWLISYSEKARVKHLNLYCALLGVVSAWLMAGIIWLVLAKPF